MFKIIRLGIVLVFALVLTACGSWQTRDSETGTAVNSEITDKNIQTEMEDIESEYGEVEAITNRKVKKWINYYTGRGRRHMRIYLERSSKYLPLMKEVLREEGIPEDLVYLPIVESGFSATAHSHASAVGYWQFIRGTGKRYGLRIDSYIDERRDPVLSTRAAAKFLKSLYNLFGDWYLSLAAYNTGENRVKRLVMKYNTRDFWQLARKRGLYRETKEYVPKYLAALIIAKNPDEYGFHNIDYQPELKFDSIPVFKSISLEKLARNIGMRYKDLKSYNMMYRSDYVPVKGNSVYIRVPQGMAQKSVSALTASYSEAPKYIPNDYYWYRVRRGDTLSEIAMKNRTTVGTLRRMNKMGRRSFIRIGQKLKVPDRGQRTLRAHKKRATARVKTASGDFHVVRRGENLTLIARRYGVTINQLRNLNGLGRRSLLKVGQKLKIKNSIKSAPKSGRTTPKTHKIKNGENLSIIAQKYGVSVRDLASWNNIRSKSKIMKGQTLKLYDNNPQIHVVKAGENLSLIAKKYKVSVAEIARKNSLKNSSKIFVGKRLVIP